VTDTSDTERLTVEDVVDHEDNCAACGVCDRVVDSRYCAGCRDALVRADGGAPGDGSEILTDEMVTTKRVTKQNDIPDLLKSLEVPIHNRWVDLRSKELGAFDYEPVELVVSYEFRSVDTDN
jgi:hypothetical protein